MRFPNSSFQLLAVNKGGVQMEPTDAELVVPAVLQPSFEYTSPWTQSPPPGAKITVSTWIVGARDDVGAQAAGFTNNTQYFGAGLWRFSWTYHSQWVGTAQPGNFASFHLIDQAGIVAPLARAAQDRASFVLDIRGDLTLHLIEEKATIGGQLTFGLANNNPTIAGDRLTQYYTVFGRKLL